MTSKQIVLTGAIAMITVSFGFSASAIAQGICVADTLNVSEVSGKVVLKFKDGEQALSHASLTLRRTNVYGRVIGKQSVSTNGSFTFKGVRPGKYLLIASEPRFTDFYVALNLERSDAKRKQQNIVIVMDVNSGKECSGSYAELRPKQVAQKAKPD